MPRIIICPSVMDKETFRLPVIAILFLSVLGQSGCMIESQKFYSLPNDVTYTDTLSSGLRAHTVDGKIVIFSPGVQITSDYLIGEGIVYGLNPEEEATQVDVYPRHSVAFMASAEAQRDEVLSAGLTLLGISSFGVIAYLFIFEVAFRNSCAYSSCN